jgi:hypothetical protein
VSLALPGASITRRCSVPRVAVRLGSRGGMDEALPVMDDQLNLRTTLVRHIVAGVIQGKGTSKYVGEVGTERTMTHPESRRHRNTQRPGAAA